MGANTLYDKNSAKATTQGLDRDLNIENLDPSLLNITDAAGVQNQALKYAKAGTVTTYSSRGKDTPWGEEEYWNNTKEDANARKGSDLFGNVDNVTKYYLNRLNEIRSALGRTDTRTATTNTLLTK